MRARSTLRLWQGAHKLRSPVASPEVGSTKLLGVLNVLDNVLTLLVSSPRTHELVCPVIS